MLALIQVTRAEFPVVAFNIKAAQQALALLFFTYVQKEFEHQCTILGQVFFKIIDLLKALLPKIFRNLLYAFNTGQVFV